jgi:MoaA/NifB/PqqE/SkfB family radical SAM enzyme
MMNGETGEFTGLSLESSQRCNLRCPLCVLRTYEDYMTRGDMGQEVVRAVVPYLGGLETVDLTGWGEPLINPHIEDNLKLIRSAFSGTLSFTTNGLLFNKKVMDACLEEGVDTICFSIDAVNEEGYARMRPGGNFERLLSNIKELVMRKKKAKAERPGLYATYLLTRDNFEKAAEFVSLTSGLGMNGVLFQQMTGVYSEQGRALVTYRNYYQTGFREEILKHALSRARESAPAGFHVAMPETIRASRVKNCGGFDIQKPFISASGDVTVCCVMAYPVKMMSRDGRVERRKQHFFGNVLESPLPSIWASPEYVAVREEIRGGGDPEECSDCIGLYIEKPAGGHIR